MLSSLNTLGKKIDIIVGYLEGIQVGRLVADHILIRKAAKNCQLLPAIDSDHFSQKLSYRSMTY
jgi:LDH2 family malate/lactate/ureidoglycolate dehydrogenase